MKQEDNNIATLPTLDQEAAIASMQGFFEPLMGGKKFFLLSGYAGTGKTFTITEFVKGLDSDVRVILTAPTNKAVRVLDRMAEKAGLVVDTGTIHSLLGLVLSYEKEKQVLKKKRASTISKYDLVIVDECSMVGEELWHTIEGSLINHSTQVIFVGDERQKTSWNDWGLLQAAKKKHIYYISPDLIQRSSPRILIGTKLLCDKINEVREATK